MKRMEHLLTVAVEECVELAQRLTKALRFGLADVQPGQTLNNRTGAIYEFNDLCAILDMLGMLEVDPELMRKKRIKVETFLHYSAEHGTLDDTEVSLTKELETARHDGFIAGWCAGWVESDWRDIDPAKEAEREWQARAALAAPGGEGEQVKCCCREHTGLRCPACPVHGEPPPAGTEGGGK